MAIKRIPSRYLIETVGKSAGLIFYYLCQGDHRAPLQKEQK
jgi:hypothetical protein